MKIKKNFYRKFIPCLYYNVPKCPSCDSYCTGRFVKFHRDTVNDWVVIEALQNGEIVVPIIDPPDDNCVCLDCGFTWEQEIKLEIVSLESVDKQKNLRGTNAFLQEKYEQELANEKDNIKKHTDAFNTVRGFLGKR